MASLLLARRRIAAGVVNPDADELVIGQQITASDVSDADIDTESKTLQRVIETNASRRTASAPSRSLVPRSASGVQRTMPSMAGDPAAPGITAVGTGGASVSDEEFNW
jgi:hypothetical protein